MISDVMVKLTAVGHLTDRQTARRTPALPRYFNSNLHNKKGHCYHTVDFAAYILKIRKPFFLISVLQLRSDSILLNGYVRL